MGGREGSSSSPVLPCASPVFPYLLFSPGQLDYLSLLEKDSSNRDAEHLLGSAWNKENRVPNTVSLPLERSRVLLSLECTLLAHAIKSLLCLEILPRFKYAHIQIAFHLSATFQRIQVHIFTC